MAFTMPDPTATPQGAMFSVEITGDHVVDGNTVVMTLYRNVFASQVAQAATKTFTLSGVTNNTATLTWTGFSVTNAASRHLIFRSSSSDNQLGGQDCYMETVITDSSNETSIASFFGYTISNFIQDPSTALQPNIDFASSSVSALSLRTHRSLSIDDDTGTALDLASSTPHTANWGDVFDVVIANQESDGGQQDVIEYFIESGGTKTYLEFSFNDIQWGQTIPASGNHQGKLRLPAAGTNGTFSFGYRIKNATTTAEVSRTYTLQFSIS